MTSTIRQMVHRSRLLLPGIVLLLIFPVVARADTPDAEVLFQKILGSFKTVDFKGTFSFTSLTPEGGPPFEATVIRKSPDKLRIEFIQPRDLAGTGMVMDGKKRWRVQGPRERRRRPLPPMRDDRMGEFLIRNAQILLKTHDISVLEAEPVASRNTYLLVLNPKRAGRPSRKVWVDAEMGVILKMESYDSRNRLQWILAYSTIDFNPEIDVAIFRPQHGMMEDRGPWEERGRQELWNYNQGNLDLDRIRKEAGVRVILPDRPPAGFILQNIQSVTFDKITNVHLSYTDGLSVLSVFQSPSGGMRPGGGREGRREGGPPGQDMKTENIDIGGIEVELISRRPMLIFRWTQDELYLTLISELSREEMIEIVRSFVNAAR